MPTAWITQNHYLTGAVDPYDGTTYDALTVVVYRVVSHDYGTDGVTTAEHFTSLWVAGVFTLTTEGSTQRQLWDETREPVREWIAGLAGVVNAIPGTLPPRIHVPGENTYKFVADDARRSVQNVWDHGRDTWTTVTPRGRTINAYGLAPTGVLS